MMRHVVGAPTVPNRTRSTHYETRPSATFSLLGWKRTLWLLGGSIAGRRIVQLYRTRGVTNIYLSCHRLQEDPLEIRTRGKYEG